MKILLLANHLNPGGIATYTLTLASGLKERGHNVRVSSRGGLLVDKLTKLGIEHIRLGLNTKSEMSPGVFTAKRELYNALRKNPADILHPQTRLTRVCAQFIENKMGIPFISTAHGFYKPRLGNRLFPYWGDGVIAISEAVKRSLVLDFKVEADNIKVIYNGINIQGLNVPGADRNRVKGKLNLNFSKLIVCIARLSFIKGHIYLIRAMAEISKVYPEAACLIVGDGEARITLERETDKLKLNERIKFIQSVEDTGEILSVADIFVLPTLQEGLGLSILEAMARGIPVVATNIGGIPEIIKNNESGLLVPPKDSSLLAEAITRLFKNGALREKISSCAREEVLNKFSCQRMTQETESFYQDIILR